MPSKIALVTGGNRGIGYEICKLLCQRFEDTDAVILTARNKEAGLEACKRLESEGCSNTHFMQLDVTSKSSIENVTKQIHQNFSSLDVLVNNAGILFPPSKSKDIPYEEQAEKTLLTNFFGVLHVYDNLSSLLKQNARVVNVTSRLGKTDIFGKALKERFMCDSLDREGLVKLMQQYISDVKDKSHVFNGWPDQDPNSWMPAAYCVSKIGVTILTNILAKECKSPGILVNCCCPGWVKTSLGGPNAPKSAQEGAADIVECALLGDGQHSGRYFQDRKLQKPYYASEAPMARLKNVEGYEGRCNDVVFCGEDAMQHVIFFPGDVQNYIEDMEIHKENKAWKEWDLESTAQMLYRRFPKSFIWVIRPALLNRGTFACFTNFFQTDACGTPDFVRPDSTALLHLQHLLDSAVRTVLDVGPDEEDVTEDFPLILVGFSKGCMVLNQIAHELPRLATTSDIKLQEFVKRIDEAYWLDAGNSGQANAWVTDESTLFHVAQSIPKVRVHVTPYQIKDKGRPWIGEEENKFVSQLKSLGMNIKEKVHFENKKPTLANHFKLIQEFKTPSAV